MTEAANEGHASAQNNLGHCYEFGKGVEKNESHAMEWYSKSAAQNHSASYINLGYLQMKHQQYQNAFESISNAFISHHAYSSIHSTVVIGRVNQHCS